MSSKITQNNLLSKIIFALVVFAWSTSWIAIKFQLVNTVAEGFSVSYRFFGASMILFAIAFIFKLPLKFNKRQFTLIFLQGVSLFFFNHLFFYGGIHYVSSGVAATFASLAVVVTPIIDYLLHKNKTSPRLIFGAIMGVIGVALIASSEMHFEKFDNNILKGLFLCFLGVVLFSFGSLIGKELRLNNIKTLICATAYSMLFGAVVSFLFTLLRGNNIAFDFSYEYVLSLLYLILIPGIVGYLGILFLVENIGSAKASYTALFYPAFALIISGIFENYHFNNFTFIGIFLLITGNLIALKTKK